jgi:hypothetical protein
VDIPEYCREIETYLCRKNDGHLIRVAGPSFDLVSKWASSGVPIKVAFRGIDRYFERYYEKGPRRRPVRIDFCEADVLDVFDEWQRAVGLSHVPTAETRSASGEEGTAASSKPVHSLPVHLERALIRLTSARATGVLGPDADQAVDRVAEELDRARSSAGGLRGDARRALLERLRELDAELLRVARDSMAAAQREAIEHEADENLAAFRISMPHDAYVRARNAAIDTLAREQLRLPVLTFQ